MMLFKVITGAFGVFILLGTTDALTTLYAINVLGASEMHPLADASSFTSIMAPYFVQGFAIVALLSFSLMSLAAPNQNRISSFFSLACLLLSLAMLLLPLLAVLNNISGILFRYSFAAEILDAVHGGMKQPSSYSHFINLVGLSITLPLALATFPYVRRNVLVPEIRSSTDIRIIVSFAIFIASYLYLFIRVLALTKIY